MAFQNSPCPFIPLASLTATVPVIAVGGLAKQFLVPGWRCGWALVHDREGVLEGVRAGMTNLSQISLGANTLVQVTLQLLLALSIHVSSASYSLPPGGSMRMHSNPSACVLRY
jgi:aspartate/methionine/tyrosine aminotransferase